MDDDCCTHQRAQAGVRLLTWRIIITTTTTTDNNDNNSNNNTSAATGVAIASEFSGTIDRASWRDIHAFRHVDDDA